jgi:hypothetical protein
MEKKTFLQSEIWQFDSFWQNIYIQGGLTISARIFVAIRHMATW